MDVTSYLLGKEAGGGSSVNNQDKTITQDGEYTADAGYTGIGTATVQTNASSYKTTATNWGNAIDKMSYYLAGNWGEPTPHTYTYEELLELAPVASQTVTEGITKVQTAKGTLAQVIQTIAQRGVIPSIIPNINGDKIDVFVTALLSQINKLESKSVSITQNGTTTITPTSGKYGLSSVEVTTNVSVPTLYPSQLSFKNDTTSTKIDLSNFSFVNMNSTMDDMFNGCSNLEEIKLGSGISQKQIYNAKRMFYGCSKLEKVDFTAFDFTACSMGSCFDQCFRECRNFNDETLDSLLVMATTLPFVSSLWGIGYWGYSSASRIQSLPHYQDFIDAGWTLGY